MTTPDEGQEVELWKAFERLDNAYLLHDDSAIARELGLIDRLRHAVAEPTAAIVDADGRLSRLAERLGAAVASLVVLPLQPAYVRSEASATTVQGDARVDDASRAALGDISASVVGNGVELGIDVRGIDPSLEDRLDVVVQHDDESGHGAPLVAAVAGTGLVSATLRWAGGLPRELIIVVLPTGRSGGPPTGRPPG